MAANQSNTLVNEINLANGDLACAVALASTSFAAITTSVNTLPAEYSITAHFICFSLTTNIYCLRMKQLQLSIPFIGGSVYS